MAKLVTTVNKSKCIASGDCVEMAPGVFQFDSGDKSEVYNQAGAADAVILAAARACPAKAITVVDEETRDAAVSATEEVTARLPQISPGDAR